MTWKTLTPEQRTHLIKSIWREGMTSKQIGNAVGATKGSIIGHYHRHRSSLAECPLMMSGTQKHREGILSPSTLLRHARENRENDDEDREYIYVPIAPRRPSLRIVGVPDTADNSGLGVTLYDNTGCMWPVNDGSPYLFCGHHKFGKYSYCERHHERSLGRGNQIEFRAYKKGGDTSARR